MRINYIYQIRAFNDRLLSNPLSSGQIALWHALMHINNKCAWIEWFTAPNLSLEALCGLSRQGINKARNVLKQEGLIDFKSNGTKATSYKINILYDHLTSYSVQDSIQSSVQGGVQDSIQSSVQNSSTLNKQDKTKLNKTNSLQADRKLVSQVYQQKIKPMDSSKNIDRVQSFLEDGLSLEVILYAIDRAEESGGHSAGYVVKILNDWVNDGVANIEDAKKSVQAFKTQFSNSNQKYKNTHTRKEKFPDYIVSGAEEPAANPRQVTITDEERKAFE